MTWTACMGPFLDPYYKQLIQDFFFCFCFFLLPVRRAVTGVR